MDLRTLSMYQAVCKLSSISKASQELFLSRQALTEVMNKLETELGTTLFVRSHNGVCLTEEGALLFSRSRKLLADWNSILNEISVISASKRCFKIGSSLALMSDEMACGLINLFEPDMTVALLSKNTDTCTIQVKSGVLDAAYSIGRYSDPDLNYIPVDIPFEETYVIMSSNHSLAKPGIIKKEDLQASKMLLPDDSTFCNQCYVDYARSIGMDYMLVPSVHSIQASIVRAGIGLVFVPGNAVTQFVKDSSMVAKPLQDFPHVTRQDIIFNRNISDENYAVCQEIAKFIVESITNCAFHIDQDGTVFMD